MRSDKRLVVPGRDADYLRCSEIVDFKDFAADERAGECEYPVVFPKPDAGLVRALRTGAGCRPRDIAVPGSLSCPL